MYIKIIVKTYLKLTLNDFSILRTLCTPCIQMRLQSLNPFFWKGGHSALEFEKSVISNVSMGGSL